MTSLRKPLWSTTQLSLHERFTLLRRQQEQHQQSTAQEVRRTLAVQHRQASAQNQRLLLQMERRPAVMAALKLKQKSLRQRLGQTRTAGFSGRVTDRLTMSARRPVARIGARGVRSVPLGLRGRAFRPQTPVAAARNLRGVRPRGIVRKTTSGNAPRGRNQLAMDSTPRFQTRPQFQTQNRPLFQPRRPLNRSQFQNQNQGRFQNQQKNHSPNQNKKRVQSQNRSQSQIRNQSRSPNQGQNQFRAQRRNQNPGQARRGNNAGQNFVKGRGNQNRSGKGGFRGGQGNQRNNQRSNRPQQQQQQRTPFRRGQGRGRNGRQGPPPSKEELDLQLDQYMASTKSSLDRELDSYMKQESG